MGPRDYRARLDFCDTILTLRINLQNRGLDLAALIFHTDECTFTNNGMFNQKNYVYWADENPE